MANQARRNRHLTPTFVIPGAAKSGTSYLVTILERHPDIFVLNVKEPCYYSKNPVKGTYKKGPDHYQAYFTGYQGQKHIGEASQVYMVDKDSPKLMKRHIPHVKVVFIFRNPVDRMYSHYWQAIKMGQDLPAFEELVMRRRTHWARKLFVNYSTYNIHLERYLRFFGWDQILALIYDDLKEDRLKTINRILGFLELSTFPKGENLNVESNMPALPYFRPLTRILHNPRVIDRARQIIPKRMWGSMRIAAQGLDRLGKKRFEYPPLNEECRSFLREEFSSSVLELSEILNRDLTHWLHR